MIRLRTLGECVIEIDGERYGPDYDVLFAGLIYLTTERGRQVPRAMLAELLWPHIEPDRRRHNLRQLLYRMRIAGVTVDGTREHVLLPDRLVAPTFSAGPAPERLVAERCAGTLVIGAFLPGYEPRFSDPFAEWVERARATLEGRVRRVLLEVAQVHRLRGEWNEVEALAGECLRLDPLNEEATLARAEAVAMVGEKNEAVAILDRYLEELGASRNEVRLPATVLRRRIAERFPARRYAGPSERCFVGRAALMEMLSTALLRARNGEGNSLMLTGAPGIGKTRLVQELGKAAVMQGVRTVRVGVDESDLQRPMAAFVDAVPQLRSLPGAIGVSPESLAFLERLTEVHRPSEPIPEEPRDPRWIAGRIRQAIVDLCDAIAGEGTLLFVIEDVHWLDASSWASIVALLEWLPSKKALIILTSRGPHPTPNTPRRGIEQLAVHPVSALPRDAADTFVRAIVADHGGRLSDEAREWCVAVGEGNPLFLRELVIHCLEGGAIHAVPPSLKGLLDARIARLGPIARRVLEAAAVLGDFASVERLGDMLQLQAHELLGALTELSESLILDEGSSTVALRHELVATRVLDGLPQRVKQLLHRRAAASFAAEASPDSTAELLQIAASHWLLAKDVAHAATMLLAAANAVDRIGASPEAIQLLDAAAALNSDRRTHKPVARRLANALALDGQWERASRVADELISMADQTDAPDVLFSDTLLAVEAAFRSGADPAPLLLRAFELARDERNSVSNRVAAGKRLVLIALLYGSDSDRTEAWELVASLTRVPHARAADLLQLRVLYEAHNGSMLQALEYARELQRLAQTEADPYLRLSSMLTASDAFRIAGLWEEHIEFMKRLLAESQRLKSNHFELRAIERIAGALLEGLGRVEGEKWVDRASVLADGSEPQWYPESLLEDRAMVSLLRGRADEALALAVELRRLTVQARHSSLWHWRAAVTMHVQSLLHLNESPIPEELLEELESVHAATVHLAVHDRTAAALALALTRSGQSARAQQVLHAYCLARREIPQWRAPEETLCLRPPSNSAA